jgi:hypothetical protein
VRFPSLRFCFAMREWRSFCACADNIVKRCLSLSRFRKARK